jgi:alpha-D-xyloside xylohydrolase
MKFTNGYWMLRDGVQASYPVEVLDVVTAPGSLSVYAPTQPIRHRGDLLKGPVVTLTYSSPMPDVIGVTITHFASEAPREPRFRLQEESADIVVSADDKAAVLTSGGPKTTAIMETDDGRHYIEADGDAVTARGIS